MEVKTEPRPQEANREILITRVLHAPREIVFRAWRDPENISRWWGPEGFTTTTKAMDFRPGGIWSFVMHGPDGRDYENRIRYEEIEEPSLLTYAQAGGYEDGGSIQFRSQVTFEPEGENTKLTLRMVFESVEDRKRVIREYAAVEGGIETIGRLAEHLALATGKVRPTMTLALPSDREVVVSRVFDAPRSMVFDAWTKPEHVKKWWGCSRSELADCRIDLRPGGEYLYLMRMPDGSQFPFKGVYREVEPPERLVHTQVLDVEPYAGKESLVTVTFEEREGKTILTETTLYASAEVRNGHLAAGLEAGAADSLEALAQTLSALPGGNSPDASRQLTITRVFDAPRELVFEAFTNPEHIEKWWGPEGFRTKVTQMDLRPGGRWRYVMTGPNGQEYPIAGVIREVVPPERFVTSDGFDGDESSGKPLDDVETIVTFEDLGGKTRLTLTMMHATVEHCRKNEEMGVMAGWSSSFNRLDSYLDEASIPRDAN